VAYVYFVLWAARESENENESLGVAPWTLVFSRLPKETWEGVTDSPPALGKNTVDFLHNLQDKLAAARAYAEEHNAKSSQRFVKRYNLRAREKSFAIGDLILWLTPDSTSSRTFSRWRGPARVVEVLSPHSYIIEIDGTRQHVRANKLKRFLVSSDSVIFCPDFETTCDLSNACCFTEEIVCSDSPTADSVVHVSNGCAVVNDSDADFGDIQTFEQCEQKPYLLPSQKIYPQQIAHLSSTERHDLLELLDKYPECFTDDPGLCTLVHHEINLLPEFRPRRLRAYRVPERLKPKVAEEIQHLLDLWNHSSIQQ